MLLGKIWFSTSSPTFLYDETTIGTNGLRSKPFELSRGACGELALGQSK